MAPNRRDVTRQLDILRAGLLLADHTIHKLKHGQPVNADAVLRKPANIRADAKEVRRAIRQSVQVRIPVANKKRIC